MSANINRVKLYYEFGGSIDWLREELIKKRYDSFKYLIPVKSKRNANIIIDIYSLNNSEEKHISITSLLKIAKIISFPKMICKDLKISPEECNTIYSYLKETIFEK